MTENEIKNQGGESSGNEPAETASVALDIMGNFFFFLVDTAKTIIIVIVIAFLIRFYLIQPFYVKGSSMLPNYLDTEYLLIDEIGYHFSSPQRGEVVVFKYPKNPQETYIKRIIGLPGEHVVIKDGKVIIFNQEHPQGVTLLEAYLSADIKTDGDQEWRLASDEYIVLGDNRPDSSDSRYWGTLPRKNIVGKSWFVFKPRPLQQHFFGGLVFSLPVGIERYGFIKNPDYPGLTVNLFSWPN